MRVVDQLRDGGRRVAELPKRSARGIKSGAKDLGSVPAWVGRNVGNAGRTVGRTVTDLPSRVTGRVRSDAPASGAAAAPAGGDRLIDRARENPGFAIAIAGGGLLLIMWIAWAVYVTTEHGERAGLGVVLSWPVLLGALILVALPFYGLFLLVQRLREGGFELGGDSSAEAVVHESAEAEDAGEEDDEEPDEGSEDSEGDDEDDEDGESEEDEDASAEAEDDEDEGDTEESPKAGSSAGA